MAETIPAWVDGRLVAVEKLEVHRRGLWHPAVSIFLVDGVRTLIQQRALGKYHTPGLWANACCTHPHPGEDPAACAARRLREELGLGPVALASLGRVAYAAPVGGGMVEREEVALFAAETDSRLPLRPDPAEVMATRWITLDALRAEVAARPEAFTPWLRIYLAGHAGRLLARAA
jgi:isopentenyl-diphosphate delta-isomerase